MYISKFIAIYLRSQVSVYRTIGPLVFILMAFSHRIKTQNRIASYCHDKKCTFAVCGVWIICLISFKCLVEHNRYLETLTQE